MSIKREIKDIIISGKDGHRYLLTNIKKIDIFKVKHTLSKKYDFDVYDWGMVNTVLPKQRTEDRFLEHFTKYSKNINYLKTSFEYDINQNKKVIQSIAIKRWKKTKFP